MILVTGASGFVGRHLLEALSKKGARVRALCHHNKNLPQYANVEWQQCNLLDVIDLEEQMQGIRQIYNCAATVSFDPKNKEKLLSDNVSIVTNIVNAALDAGVEKMVHVSSIASLGRNRIGSDEKLINEESDFEEGDGNSLYAQGKYYGEMEVWRGMAEGLNSVIVNPGVILGVGDWQKGSAKLIQVVNDEFAWFTEGRTSWVGVKDVVSAMMLLMGSAISEERFILSENNHTYKDIFTQMAIALGKRPPYKKAAPWMTEVIWRLSMLKSRMTGTEPTITKETAKTATSQYIYDNSKFLNTFPEFKYTPINEVIVSMADAFKKRGNDTATF